MQQFSLDSFDSISLFKEKKRKKYVYDLQDIALYIIFHFYDIKNRNCYQIVSEKRILGISKDKKLHPPKVCPSPSFHKMLPLSLVSNFNKNIPNSDFRFYKNSVIIIESYFTFSKLEVWHR